MKEIMNPGTRMCRETGDIRTVEEARCQDCAHCGPPVGSRIRCDHPDWDGEETDMRAIDPSFAEACVNFETPTTQT